MELYYSPENKSSKNGLRSNNPKELGPDPDKSVFYY